MVFEAPHSPFDPPEPYDRMYDNFTIPDPICGEWVNDKEFPLAFEETKVARKFHQLSEEMVKESRRRYYGQISHIDYQLGRFFGELKSKGLYDNTVIVFTADHGEHLGDHGIFAKSTFLKGSADVPLIMRLPKNIKLQHPGLEFDMPVLTADICPTLLDIAEVKPKTKMDGISLLPYISGEKSNKSRTIFGEFGTAHSNGGTAFANDGNFKYIYYAAGGMEQLFDEINDKNELNNLAQNQNFLSIKNELKGKLIEYLKNQNSLIIKDEELKKVDYKIDRNVTASYNPCAWRGPLRHGQGY
jgi:arylsulfatase A-like enzyme